MKKREPFVNRLFLSHIGEGRAIKNYKKNRRIFSQGDLADGVFYVQEGKVKLTVVSQKQPTASLFRTRCVKWGRVEEGR